jgi:alpha-L-fucosidase
MKISRRTALQLFAGAGASICLPNAFGQTPPAPADAPVPAPSIPPAPTPIVPPAGFGVAPGPFQPTLESLSAYQVPDWYRDAKFGIWAHWGPQCQPEMGDWYAQKMYQFNGPIYKFHVQKYGHPSKFGFKDVINEWKAEQWDPVALIALYKKAGAKFFSGMANHHDNMDMWDSTYQPWNSINVGPKKDIIGGWEKAARDAGLRFGISCHGAHTWDWLQVSQGSDTSGPLKGVPYDGVMAKADGKGLWWEGLDPQDLYAQYHARGKWGWNLTPAAGSPPVDKAYVEKFFNRIADLIDKHNPDLLYFDDTVMPMYPSTDIGPRIAAYLYNTNITRHGQLEAVMTGKDLNKANAPWRKALMLDLERGVSNGAETVPWQTDTCIGNWHYQRSLFEQHKYKTAKQVVQMLVDIVSKNGNLMLNIPLPGRGMPDDDEMKILSALADWIGPNGDGIYGTRPFSVYGEGPSVTKAAPANRFGGAVDVRAYTPEDVRFTKKGDTVYAFLMGWPTGGKAVIKTLTKGADAFPRDVARVELLGVGPVAFTQDASGLTINLPEQKPNDFAYGFKIDPA